MDLIFRGVRGSIAVPGPDTAKYGGNTTCIQIKTSSGENIIIDGGTGIRLVGQEMLAQMPVKCSIFITHTHWDHIQGLPFFLPLMIPGNEVDIYGTFDPIYQKDIKAILSQQMEYCYFPLRENDLKAKINYFNVRELETMTVGDASITGLLMNHPVLNHGYRVEADGKSIFFTGDHEPQLNFYEPGEDGYEEFQADIDEKEQVIVDFIRGVDLFIADTQYTEDEYPQRAGWGHGTYKKSIELAKKANIKRLIFTHHEPVRTDQQLDEIYQSLLADHELVGDLDIAMAVEGVTITL
ncbi:MAG: MBL fold metallo-hydrolase [Pseudomonadota bacterium]